MRLSLEYWNERQDYTDIGVGKKKKKNQENIGEVCKIINLLWLSISMLCYPKDVAGKAI